ncbi:MAG: demethoxyubiquinone hydroxylase family protein [Syntrophales bacterium]|nr:demethoxyubiquinone hydroxylase family protein [Syntrophales bacterium]MDD5232010.1 demethoxyubiquinone hydroxylase family protein [Syntrophales bacterium]MDD5533253.1 demethoxyubiquinone hydroxylase family protein [Syntrophales bacterium]HPL64382.1 demethoxyubiquinone hydroxylase family protein [Syntrophales bacterium]
MEVNKPAVDISVIRPQIAMEDLRLRGEDIAPERLKAMRRGLLILNTLEIMAINVYKYQIKGDKSEMDRLLIAAMANEMTHFQDFQIKIYEFGWKPFIFRWAFWISGMVLGAGSRMLGRKASLKADIWLESQAVHHYGILLDKIEWDPVTRAVIEKNRSDEQGHIDRWRKLL